MSHPRHFPRPQPGSVPSYDVNATGTFTGTYREGNLDLKIEFLNIHATGYHVLEVKQNIHRELERAFAENKDLERLISLIPYFPRDLECEAHGKIHPVQTDAYTAKGIADIIAGQVCSHLLFCIGKYPMQRAAALRESLLGLDEYDAIHGPINPPNCPPRLHPEAAERMRNAEPHPYIELLQRVDESFAVRNVKNPDQRLHDLIKERMVIPEMAPQQVTPVSAKADLGQRNLPDINSLPIPTTATPIMEEAEKPDTAEGVTIAQDSPDLPSNAEEENEEKGLWDYLEEFARKTEEAFLGSVRELTAMLPTAVRRIVEFKIGFDYQLTKRAVMLVKDILHLIYLLSQLGILGTKFTLKLVAYIVGRHDFNDELAQALALYEQIAEGIRGIPDTYKGHIDALHNAKDDLDMGRAVADLLFDIAEIITLVYGLVGLARLGLKLMTKAAKAARRAIKKGNTKARKRIRDWKKALDERKKRKAAEKAEKAEAAAARKALEIEEKTKLASQGEKAQGGVFRRAKYGHQWQTVNMQECIDKFVGKDPVIEFNFRSGKKIYANKKTGIQVVEDINGKYFRIENTKIKSVNRYFDLSGKVPDKYITPKGKMIKITDGYYLMITHFIKG